MRIVPLGSSVGCPKNIKGPSVAVESVAVASVAVGVFSDNKAYPSL